MHLSIYTLQSTLFEGEVNQVILPTPLGEITILENHLPLVTLVNRGTLRYAEPDNQEKTLPLEGGVAEVRPGSEVVILTGA